MRVATFAPLTMLLLAACQAGPPPPTFPASSATSAPSPSLSPAPSPSPARTLALDQALVDAHEEACQAENERVLYGDPGETPSRTLIDDLPRVVTAQPDGRAVHVYADGIRWVICYPKADGRVSLEEGEVRQLEDDLFVSSGGVIHGSLYYEEVVHVQLGLVDPAVARLSAIVPGEDEVEAWVAEGWYVFIWDSEERVSDYRAYDACGNDLMQVRGDELPCPPP